MKNLLMCRVCLLEDDRSKSIVGTHLQEVYDSLTLMPFETTDGRPLLLCYICRARLQNCYELRKSCLESEKLFTQMLSCNEYEQVRLQAINNKKRLTIHNTVEWIVEMDEDSVDVETLNCEVQDDSEDVDNPILEEKCVSDNVQSADLDEEIVVVITVKEEQIGYNTNIDKDDLGASSVSDDVLPADSDNKNEESMEHKLEMDADSDGSETLVMLCDVKDESNDSKDFSGDVLKRSSVSNNELPTVSDSENSMGILKMDADDVGVETLVFDVQDEESDPEDIHENSLQEHNRLPAVPDNNFVITVREQIGHQTVAEDSASTDLKYDILIQNTSQDILSEEIKLAIRKPYQCSICHRRFEQRRYLHTHMHSHTAVKPYQCDVCKKRFASRETLYNHMKIHIEPFQCHICEKVVSIKNKVVHMRTHTGEKRHQCGICNKQFAVKGNLNRHIRSHTGEKLFQCDVCKNKFATKDSLKYHKRKHYKGKPNINECTICNDHFECENELKLHIHTHADAETFLCDICNKVVTQKSVLRRHMRAHTGVWPKLFQCDICKKQFTANFLLKLHMRTHTGEKPYPCEICKKQFSQKCSLTKHMRTHTG